MDLENFLDEYFKLIQEINDFHFNYLVSNKFYFPETDYYELKRFIDTATNFLSEIDDELMNGLTGKLYLDMSSLYNFYQEFIKKSQYIQIAFQEYLENIEEYKILKEEVEQLKKSIEEYNTTIIKTEERLKGLSQKDALYKRLKKIHVDSIYELSLQRDKFHEAKKNIEELEKKRKMNFFQDLIN